MKPFTSLTKKDVQKLRRKPMAVSFPNSVDYDFTQTDIADAKKYLETLYTGTVTPTFAAKILLNNKIY